MDAIDLPHEIWFLIMYMCDEPTRLCMSQISRLHYALFRNLDSICRIKPCAPTEIVYNLFHTRRKIQVHAIGEFNQWCFMATAYDLREIKWIFNSTPRASYEHLQITRQFSSYAIPNTLGRLELQLNSPIGDCVLKSLCASLPCAKSLNILILNQIGVPDLAHIINSLSIRATDNYAIPLETLHINICEQNSSIYPSNVQISGLRWIRDLSMIVHPHTQLTDQSGAQQIIDEFTKVSEASLINFAYWGMPLQNVTQWSKMIHRSQLTLIDVVVPAFSAELPPTDTEIAIDNASQLKNLTIVWQKVRLDFVLKNKSNLETLIHYGTAYNVQLLIPQLAVLHNIQKFHMDVNIGSSFVEQMKRVIKWPKCTSFYAGGCWHTTKQMMFVF